MQADDGTGPLFLQAKEAQVSVLADYAGAARYSNQGERVVAGQRLMQAASDIFLGWQRATGADGVERDFYIRQLRDWKLSVPIEHVGAGRAWPPTRGLCGWTLARAHARSGDRIADRRVPGPLGRSSMRPWPSSRSRTPTSTSGTTPLSPTRSRRAVPRPSAGSETGAMVPEPTSPPPSTSAAVDPRLS